MRVLLYKKLMKELLGISIISIAIRVKYKYNIHIFFKTKQEQTQAQGDMAEMVRIKAYSTLHICKTKIIEGVITAM